MPFKKGKSGSDEHKFTKENPRPGPGRPRTKLIREYVREIEQEIDPKTKQVMARKAAKAIWKKAAAGSLGHFQQVLQLTECDIPGPGITSDRIDADAIAKLLSKVRNGGSEKSAD